MSGFLASEDCLATLAAMRALGVHIELPSPTLVVIRGVGLRGLRDAGRALYMGNAGTAMRLFAGLLSAQPFGSRLIGDASLMQRPMERVAKPLREITHTALQRRILARNKPHPHQPRSLERSTSR